MRKSRNILRISCFIIIAIFAAAAAESFFRLKYEKQFKKISRIDHVLTTGRSPIFFFAAAANMQKHPSKIYEGIPGIYWNNSHGYRDCEHAFEKPPGVFRIVVIGDSVAVGYGIKLEDTFGRVLENKLNAADKRRKYEVIVLAVTGYSTSQELIVLKDEAFRYNPDLIVWSYALNDPAHPLFHGTNGLMGLYFYKPKIYLFYYMRKKLFYVREAFKTKFLCCSSSVDFHDFIHVVYRNEVKKNINTIGKISKQKKAPVLFLIIPIFYENATFQNYPLVQLHKKLKDTAYEAGLMPIDLLDTYRHYDQDELDQNPGRPSYDPWHINEKGHSLAADRLYSEIMSKFNTLAVNAVNDMFFRWRKPKT
ncbi:MAG: SGNH/GDSL hydrolase family protein [Candidatus Omnitrophica bacterium]|nr:SGNH/GDSL hydrolase family protein [Candidatus Omnitrophota bacterium]